ncbi:MAG: hypothetical protein ABI895_40050 [Deltaproteobacteria bacterium]
MVRHTAAAVLVLGCSEILGIPDAPQLLPPEAAALEPDLSLASTGSPDEQGAARPSAEEEAANARLGPVPGGATDAPDGGTPINVPTFASDADVTSTGDRNSLPGCAPITQPSISDFTNSPGSSATSALFGMDAAFLGGTYFYSSSGSLSSSMLDANWHLSGTVDSNSGFGLYSNACQPFDASTFLGMAFNLWGHIDGDQQLVFFVESAAQQVSSSWLNANKADPTDPDSPPSSGRCIPTTSRYDGSCREPRMLLTVTSEPVAVVIPWADFAGGSPVATLDPRELTAIAWSLPPPGDTPYGVDIHIDDLRFVVP